MNFLIHFTIAFSSLVAIVLSCILFTNAIEFLGNKLKFNNSATGSILAVFGTGLPETIVPIIAVLGSIFISKDLSQGQDIALGAIFGSPFMLSTFALFLMGVVLFVLVKKSKRSLVVQADYKNILRYFKYFIFAYLFALAVCCTTSKIAKCFAAVILFSVYVFFVYRTILKSKDGEEKQEEIRLYFEKIFRSQNNFILAIQILISLVALTISTHFFVEGIKYFSLIFNLKPAILSLIVVPFATELPEITNSIIWVKQGKDELALSNIIGAVVFQVMILSSIGMVLTPWKLDVSILTNCALTIFCAILFTFFAVKYKKITVSLLLACGIFYLLYILFLIIK